MYYVVFEAQDSTTGMLFNHMVGIFDDPRLALRAMTEHDELIEEECMYPKTFTTMRAVKELNKMCTEIE